MRRVHYIGVLFFFTCLAFSAIAIFDNSEFLRDILLSIGSSGLFALLIEIGFYLNDRMKFGYLRGNWERVEFFNRNDNTSDMGYNDISDRYSNIPNKVKLIYEGDGEYKGSANYEEGKVSFSLSMHRENNHSGGGTYQYETTRSQTDRPDFGLYTFWVDKNRSKIYISHQNVLPSGTARGLEVWQRITAST